MPRKNNTKEKVTAVGENFFIISPEKKKKIFGILLLLIALLSFLSILSYSRADESSLYSVMDLFKILNPSPELQERIVTINNWLGLFGAYISYFLIHSTIGLFSIIFPAILFLWGWAILGKVQYKLALHISNFLLVTALLLSTFFGLIRFTPEISLFTDVNELSGNVGASLGTILSRLLGGLGGIIFIGTGLAITLIIAFDVHFSTIINFIKELFSKSGKEEVETENAVEDESANANLDKIKNLRTEKTSKAIVANKSTELEEAETLPETKITIVQKDIPTVEAKPVIKEEITNSKTSKTEKPKNEDDDSLPLIDKNAEAELPDQWDEKIVYNPPTLDLLIPPGDEDIKVNEAELKRNAALLKDKLALFDIQIDDITVTPGPVVTLYEIVPAPGVKISRIVSLEHDIALALAARGIRIIAPIPGKSAIGVEIPNAQSTIVRASSVLKKIRESKEEVGVTPVDPAKVAVFKYYFPHDNFGMQVWIFTASKWQGEPSESEEMKPQWFNLKDIPYDQMWSDDRIWMPKVFEGKKLVGSFMFDKDGNITDYYTDEVNSVE